MKLLKIAAMACAVALSGCADLGSLVTSTTVSLTSASTTQATTVAEATQAATLAEQAVDLYVKNGNPSPAILKELQTLLTGIHTTLVAAENANAAGNSAAAAAGLAAFNEALAAYESYATATGVSH